MHRPPYRPALVLVFVVLGLLIAVAFNTTSRLTEVRSGRASDLVDVVQSLEQQRDDLQNRLAELRSDLARLEREAAADSGVSKSFSRELDRVRQAAGLSAVTGSGVEVVLGDGSEVAPGTDPNDYLIHDTDIAAVVNALFVGGAEAVEINGERLVATTPIRCAGTTVLVNSARLGSPYVIRAIGDPAVLEQAVLGDESASLLFDAYMSQYGLQVSLARSSDLMVAGYRGSMRPQYVRPARGGA
ncbi:MAG: DUF881 domain-containing protein [Coriobacteriia bacterium]|nr:DUF881 domain-containing protein [Coriobacteriia bacterium]